MLNIKKLSLIIMTAILVSSVHNCAFAKTAEDEATINERIASVGFGKFFTADPQKEITNLFKKLDSYNEKSDIKKTKMLYSEDFVNNDGFDKTMYMKAVKSGYTSYENKKVTTKINSISVNDSYAVVHVTENGEAETVKPSDDIGDKGQIIASADVYYYLQKINKKWQITSANVVDENFSILYGYAKNVYFALNVPNQIKANSEYTATLSFAPMKDVLVSASINHEPIIYPTPTTSKAFKTVNSDGVLERIFTANSDNYNEYVIASIGLSRPKMVAQNSYNIQLEGTAFVIRRVNVFKPITPKIPKKNSEKEKE